jgi:hypothetical protein
LVLFKDDLSLLQVLELVLSDADPGARVWGTHRLHARVGELLDRIIGRVAVGLAATEELTVALR